MNAASFTVAEVGSESEWLVRLRNNDSQAFEWLVQQFGARMLGTARRLLRREEDCEDAVQRAFCAAYKALPEFAGNSTLNTWLHRIVVNECLMHLRRQQRRPETSLEGLLPQFDDTHHHVEPVAAWTRRPDDEASQHEVRTLVRQAIDSLPDEFRTVLVLRDIEELSTQETADRLGTTCGAIKTRLHRARQALRTLLDRHFAS